MKKFKLTLLPGDGIGKEVINAVYPVFDKLELDFNIKFGEIGWECWKKFGEPIPVDTWKLIDSSDAIILGAITSKGIKESEDELDENLKGLGLKYISPIIQLRQKLGLYANIRPIFSIEGNKTQINDNINMIIIRENTEGLYAGLDFNPIPKELFEFVIKNKNKNYFWDLNSNDEGALALLLLTKTGLERIIRCAFKIARDKNFNLLTWVDKPNVMRESGQFAINILSNIAKEFPEINWEVRNVDAMAMWMVKDPSKFGVIVSENQFGDILSDLGAGLMGGLGFAPSINLGENNCYYEPVHGSAPKYAGLNKVNPTAMFLTIALMLENHGFEEKSKLIKKAINQVISENKIVTYDLGGTASTSEMADEIIRRIGESHE